MIKPNPVLLRKGYAPAGQVAAATEKALSTIHRMAARGSLSSVKDGAALYIHLASAEKFWRAESPPLADAIAKLRLYIAKQCG